MQKNQEISHENTDFQFPFKNQQGWQQSPGVEGQLLTSDRAGSLVHTLHHFLLSPWQVKWRWVAPIMYCGTHALLSLGLACLASHVTCPMLTVTVICKSDAWVWSKPLYDHPLWCSSWVLDPWEFLQTTPQAFRKCRGTRDQCLIKLPTSIGSQKKQENSGKTSTSSSLTMLNFWLCGTQQAVENSLIAV